MYDDIIGKVIDGKFRVLSQIGAGAFGNVYKAEQIGFDRLVAVKLLTDTSLERKENLARFEREAKVLCALRNEHIVDLFSFGIYNGN